MKLGGYGNLIKAGYTDRRFEKKDKGCINIYTYNEVQKTLEFLNKNNISQEKKVKYLKLKYKNLFH